jgi:anti-sigma-K factor RskA
VEKSYQLWIASELTGGAPKSLGVIDNIAKPSRHILADFDAGAVQRATFGVSLEPLGGSPTDRPTGPVFHAKLIPASR